MRSAAFFGGGEGGVNITSVICLFVIIKGHHSVHILWPELPNDIRSITFLAPCYTFLENHVVILCAESNCKLCEVQIYWILKVANDFVITRQYLLDQNRSIYKYWKRYNSVAVLVNFLFNFMQFLGKHCQSNRLVYHPLRMALNIWEILDPSLHNSQGWNVDLELNKNKLNKNVMNRLKIYKIWIDIKCRTLF